MELRDQLQSTLGDGYRIERELGGGGMSRVFIAEEIALGRKVVVKVLPPEMAAAVSMERFKREISLAARLQHPHVVPLLSAGQSGDLPYFTMPYIEGESLRARLTREGELPVSDAVRILREIASALDYAHEKGIVHRDIKPDNVLLSRGSAMVTDFGVAKALSASTNVNLTEITSVGTALGTPSYMSPEQAVASDAIDARADIYALGAMAYELFAGRAPFAGRSPQATLAAHVTEAPEPITRLRPSLPPALASLVMRCLEKHASDRPQSAAQVIQTLDSITTPSGGSQPAAASLEPAAREPATVNRGIVAGAVFVAAVVIALVAWRFVGDTPSGATEAAAPQAIAVLPFEMVGSDTANEYFGAGMADALTSALSKVPGLSVRAPRSASSAKGRRDIADIGRALNVFAVVDGKAQRAGNRLRLTASLTRVTDGTVLWSDTYTREISDIFAVQDELARSVATALQAKFANSAGALVAAPTTDLEAYDMYLKGRFLWNQRTKASLLAAIELFKKAIVRDPRFALAYVGLADAHIVYPQYALAKAIESYRPAEEAARRAIALDSTSAEVHASLGILHTYQYRWERADAEFRQAIALRPQYAPARLWYGLTLTYQGKFDEGRAQLARGKELEPTSAVIATAATQPITAKGDFARSQAELERVLELDPGYAQGHRRLARVLVFKGGDLTRAEAEVRRAAAGSGLPESGLMGYVLARSGRRAEAERIAAQLVARSRREYVSPASIGMIYIGLGNMDEAFRWITKGVEDFEATTVELNSDPMFQPLRGDSRYQALLAKMNLR